MNRDKLRERMRNNEKERERKRNKENERDRREIMNERNIGHIA